MAGEKCPKCGSTDTVRHIADSALKPDWLHCNEKRCSYCEETPGGGEGAGEGEDDREFTKAELIGQAEERGIEVPSRATRTDILDLIDAHDAGEGEGEANE